MEELHMLVSGEGKNRCYGMLAMLGKRMVIHQELQTFKKAVQAYKGIQILVEYAALMKYGEEVLSLIKTAGGDAVPFLYGDVTDDLTAEAGFISVVPSRGRSDVVWQTTAAAAYRRRTDIQLQDGNPQNQAVAGDSEQFGELSPFAGVSTARNRLLRLVYTYASLKVPLLLTGEAGTGKSYLARLIANEYRLRQKIQAYRQGLPEPVCPYVSCPIVSYSSSTMESTLFGHVKGAYTGADADHEGKIAAAAGGTLFLDEVADTPLEVQPKLLEFLQEHTYSPMGSNDCRVSDARILSATNKDLMTELETGRLRRDFLERIAGKIIHVPSLNERLEDIPVLASHFLEETRQTWGGPEKVLSQEAVWRLQEQDWTNRNVRGLKNLILRMVIESESEVLTADLVENCLQVRF